MHDRALNVSKIDTGTSIKSDEVDLVLWYMYMYIFVNSDFY